MIVDRLLTVLEVPFLWIFSFFVMFFLSLSLSSVAKIFPKTSVSCFREMQQHRRSHGHLRVEDDFRLGIQFGQKKFISGLRFFRFKRGLTQ